MGSEAGRKALLAAKLFPLGKDIEKMIKMQVFIYNFQKKLIDIHLAGQGQNGLRQVPLATSHPDCAMP